MTDMNEVILKRTGAMDVNEMATLLECEKSGLCRVFICLRLPLAEPAAAVLAAC